MDGNGVFQLAVVGGSGGGEGPARAVALFLLAWVAAGIFILVKRGRR